MPCTGPPDGSLHDGIVLVQRCRADFCQTDPRIRFRRAHVQHFAFHAQFVARSYRQWPAQFIEARVDDTASGHAPAVHQQPFGESRLVSQMLHHHVRGAEGIADVSQRYTEQE
ncbi:hypothetical protein [Luteimonas fraxinea]|uniref:hypothetical protein n=1 Tax=Luteimonas fraxinea TaxID=2901869 RepID=UPI001E5ED584|nr:hypothetical protein [Luteimonas fraxinea]